MPAEIPTLEMMANAVRSGSVKAVELVQLALDRIDRLNNGLNAFVEVDHDGALSAADEIDARVARGDDAGPLAGLPFGVKDLEDAIGLRTTRGSRWFASSAPAHRDDLHVERLRAAGAIPVGKTAAPEFGSAPFTANLVQGVTRNPWDPTRTPGGSSGGSAVAVAVGMVPFCTASDGGGSIRTPAGFTGLPGLRPSFGRVPSYGSTHVAQNAVNFALAPTTVDTALLLDVCAGADRRDRTSLPSPPGAYRESIDELAVAGLRAAFSECYGLGPADAEVRALVTKAFHRLCAAAELVPVDVDVTLPFFYETYAKIEGVDQWIDLPDGLWPDRADELGEALQQSWASAARARLPQIARVFTDRRRLEHQVAALFEHFDVLVTPTAGVVPFAAEGPIPRELNGIDVHPFVGLAQPIMPSLCNLPAMSVPAGLTSAGLPVGMQIIAPQHREDICLRLAVLFEAAESWPRHPHAADAFAPLF